MVDSEKDKVVDYPLNSIVIPPYTREEVISGKEEEGKLTLKEALDYITQLLNESDNVQDFLTSHQNAFTFIQEQNTSQS